MQNVKLNKKQGQDCPRMNWYWKYAIFNNRFGREKNKDFTVNNGTKKIQLAIYLEKQKCHYENECFMPFIYVI